MTPEIVNLSGITEGVTIVFQRSATVNSVNQSGLAYSYLVNVREIASGLTGSFDPVIQNKNR